MTAHLIIRRGHKAILTWAPVVLDGERTATVVCANGHTAYLSDHDIGADGSVSPSVDCGECDWHVHIRLGGWSAYV